MRIKLSLSLLLCLAVSQGRNTSKVESGRQVQRLLQDSTKLNEDIAVFRVKRDDECLRLVEEAKACVSKSSKEYQEAAFGEDNYKEAPEGYNKPDYVARKTCNYLTATVEECSMTLYDKCSNPDDAIKKKEMLIKHSFELRESIPGFDADKCPLIKEYLERNSGSEYEEQNEEYKAGFWSGSSSASIFLGPFCLWGTFLLIQMHNIQF